MNIEKLNAAADAAIADVGIDTAREEVAYTTDLACRLVDGEYGYEEAHKPFIAEAYTLIDPESGGLAMVALWLHIHSIIIGKVTA